MIIVFAVQGTRGDVEPCAAVALELVRRGHEVRMAVPPNLIAFVESTGLTHVVPYGPDSRDRALSWDAKSLAQWTADHRPPTADVSELFSWHRLHNPAVILSQLRSYLTDQWAQMSETVRKLATDADLIVTGMTYQEVAANVAEFYRIPLVAMHYAPIRPSSASLPLRLPTFVSRPVFAAAEWAYWRLFKPAEDAQRESLGLPKARRRSQARIDASGALEIQAYDPIFYPGLSAEWGERRPIVGSITLQKPGTADDRVLDWIEAGPPPIYLGLGSMPVKDPTQAVAMVADACAKLGQRALISLSEADVVDSPDPDRVMIVSALNHSVVFPRCRAIAHHGGSGTTAASVRAGVPTVVLWMGADQPAWAKRIEELGVGAGQRFSTTTTASLTALLRKALEPNCAERAHEVAEQMSTPADSLARAASLIEDTAKAAHLDGSARA